MNVRKSPIPEKGPVQLKVCGFGKYPDHSDKLTLLVNGNGPYEFSRSIFWRFEDEMLAPEEQLMLNSVWMGECEKMGIRGENL